jgi:hypothetical protein
MPTLDFLELMRLYARRGIADWKTAPTELRGRAARCLGTAIAENEAEANVSIYTLYDEKNASRLRFIPMPKHPTGGIERCFFIPVRELQSGGKETVAFELFLLVARTDCLAFRFEPAHAARSVHNYAHVQFSRKMLRKTIDVKGVPEWLPDSYPAFPTLTAEPVGAFLCMVTAVHGYKNGCTAVLQDIFAGRLGELALYLNELKRILV